MTLRPLFAATSAALMLSLAAATPAVATETATASSAPPIRQASPGTPGGAVTAVVRWATPVRSGGATAVFYQIRAYRVDSRNRVVKIYHASSQVPRARAKSVSLPRGRYKFRVQAWNSAGSSPWSSASRIVAAR